jgi:hypothetical protein
VTDGGVPVDDRRGWTILIAVGVNLVLGIPGIVPLFLAYFILWNGPLAELGWTVRDPNEDDGMLIAFLISLPVFCLAGLSWALVNGWLRRRSAAPGAVYWPMSALACLAPYSLLVSRGLWS